MSDAGQSQDSARVSTDLSGKRIGAFHFLRRLGRGAMADVYLAEQTQLKRWVAVKILKPELADDKTCLRRFEREAQAAASLVHANIVQIHEVGHVEGLHFIVQEYVQGQNLREWLGRNGPPLLQPALSIMRQIAAALSKAAEQGVVHRDIKPENIMITAAGEVKVADFGLARVLRESDNSASALTQVGITMGTPLYMSPEQVEGRALDHRSDIYSFGVLCYHMFTGKPPFVGDTALAVAVQHVKTQPQALETQRPDLPAALCRIVHQMLAKDPEQRWRSCNEILRELYRIQLEYCPQATPEDLAAWSAVGLEPLSDPRMQAQRQLAEAMRHSAGGRSRRAGWLVALTLTAATVLGGVAAWFTMRPASLAAAQHSEKAPVPQQDTEIRQYFYASRIGTEEAWESVIAYPGASEYVQLRAKQQLARLYLRKDDFTQALKYFDELAAVKDDYAEFKAFGLAGKCVTLERTKENAASVDAMNQLWNYRNSLRDNEMKAAVGNARERNAALLGAGDHQQWDEWLKQEYGPGG